VPYGAAGVDGDAALWGVPPEDWLEPLIGLTSAVTHAARPAQGEPWRPPATAA
jgi:hypothetical protein